MSKAALCLLLLLPGAVAVGQEVFYLNDTHQQEYLYPVVVPYADEQTALTFDVHKSEFYQEITKDCKARNPAGKTAAVSSTSTGKDGETSVVAILDLPASWQNREKVIAFAPQKLAFTLLINDQEVTRIEKEIPVQFRITPLLKEKGNQIELRFTGRSVYKAGVLNTISLLAVPAVHVTDVDIFGQNPQAVASANIGWFEDMEVKNYGTPPYLHDNHYTTQFYDPSINLVKQVDPIFEHWKSSKFRPLPPGEIQSMGTGYSAGDFKLWNAETPHLYRYTLQVTNPAKETVEVLSGKAGFRGVNIHGNQLSLNNIPFPVPLTLKPVLYRLPASFDSLHSEAILRPALASLKAHNVNTIILSGYPTGPEVYQLCDELGLYVVQKIDMLRPDELQKLTLDQRAEEGRKERTKLRAAALHLEEHPSVIAIYLDKNYSTSLADKLVLQEVNGLVSITAYKDRLVFMQRAYELTLPFDLYRVPDWNTLNLQQRADLKKQYQYAEFMVKGASENNLYLTNEHDFVGLEEWELRWQITGNGKTVQEGRIADLQVLPKKTLQITLPFSFQSYQDREGCVFRFTLDRKTGNAWAKPRDESAWEEFKLVRSPQGLLLLRSDDWSAAAKY